MRHAIGQGACIVSYPQAQHVLLHCTIQRCTAMCYAALHYNPRNARATTTCMAGPTGHSPRKAKAAPLAVAPTCVVRSNTTIFVTYIETCVQCVDHDSAQRHLTCISHTSSCIIMHKNNIHCIVMYRHAVCVCGLLLTDLGTGWRSSIYGRPR
jgi:hypothetical protein